MVRAAITASLFLFAAPAFAQGTMYDKDPQRKMKENVEEIFGLYVLNPSRRHPSEKVVLNPGKNGSMGVELSLFFDQRDSQTNTLVKCYAYRWLLFGRLGKDGGARTLFTQYPKVTHTDIIFYTLESTRDTGADGKYTVKLKRENIMSARLTRRRAKELKWESLEKTLAVDGDKCAIAGEKAVDKHWYAKSFSKR